MGSSFCRLFLFRPFESFQCFHRRVETECLLAPLCSDIAAVALTELRHRRRRCNSSVAALIFPPPIAHSNPHPFYNTANISNTSQYKHNDGDDFVVNDLP